MLETKNIVIATGSEPTPLHGVEIDEERVVSSTGALSLKTVPKRMIVIGAGIIGLELGSVWRRLGAEVTVVEYLDRILPGADGEVAKQVAAHLRQAGHRVQTRHEGDRRREAEVEAETVDAAGRRRRLRKRSMRTSCCWPSAAVRTRKASASRRWASSPDKRGVRSPTSTTSTSAAGVWVIGDVTSGPMLAHKAEDEAVACAELIAGKAGHVNYDIIPGVVYTKPEIAWVGKTEEELKAAGIAYKVGKFPFSANSRAKTNHETDGFAKILADATTDQVLGAHLVGVGVGEMIAEVCVAMEFGASSEDIARTCHAHPTLTEAIRQASMAVEGWTMQM